MSQTSDMTCDVLVIGAGTAGIPAAIGAARAGARVILLEDDAVPGGAAVDQYVSMPDGGPRSGIVLEMIRKLEQRYSLTGRPVDKWWYFWYLPADYQLVVSEMLAGEPNIQLICSAHVQRLTMDGNRVTGAVLSQADGSERRIRAHVTIEATGDGALAEAAGCEARYGEDAQTDFNEAPAPAERTSAAQLCTWMYISQRIPGRPLRDPDFFPRGCESGGFGTPPTGCDLTPWRERNAGIYLHWGCRVACRDTRDPQALAAAQQEAMEVMRPNLENLRANGYSVALAPRIGVRESRRILGDYVVSANDLFQGNIPDDSVLITQRPIDIWSNKRNNFDYPETRPYGIPYRALLPRGVEGLLVVGKHMSGTHLAMASYRVQPLLGQIGQAAGVAAALACIRRTRPRDIQFSDLKPRLTEPAQGLILDADPSRLSPP